MPLAADNPPGKPRNPKLRGLSIRCSGVGGLADVRLGRSLFARFKARLSEFKLFEQEPGRNRATDQGIVA